MADIEVHSNWAPSPAETILAVLHAEGVKDEVFRIEVDLDESPTHFAQKIVER